MARTFAGPNLERQNRLIFVGAIVLAAIAALLVFAAVRGMDDGGGGGSESFAGSVDVVVAAREIPAGTAIGGDDLELATLPGNGIVEGALTSREGLDGLVVRQTMAKGEQFTAAKVGQELGSEDNTLSAIVPPGYRAVAVEVDENTVVGGLVVAGDRVDLIAVLDGEGDALTNARTILQDVEVLAVAQSTQKPVARFDRDGNQIQTDSAGGSLSTRPDDTAANEDANSITLAVSPEDAPLVVLAQSEGTIWVLLRGQGDGEILPIGPATLED